MGVYTQIFATIGDTAKLERTVNRYKWLLKRLEARKEIWAIFPPGWHVPQLLCFMFCNITKTMLAEILDLKVGAATGCTSVNVHAYQVALLGVSLRSVGPSF
jgi:hypothetical protein